MSFHDSHGLDPSAGSEPFLRLLYLYLWPFAFLRDVTRGKRLERQMNYRYNRAMRVHLPAFALRWGFLTAFSFGLGIALGNFSAAPLLTALVFTSSVWALSVAVVVLTAWFWLAHFPELY